jgi:gamma-glutamylputrescine oxidase
VGTVTAEHAILAGNGYLLGLAPVVEARIMPINSFVVTTEPLGEARARALIANDAAVADSRFVVNYFRRTADHRLLFGGGESYGPRLPAELRGRVRPRLEGIFPQLRGTGLDHAWAGAVAITRQRLPLLQHLGPRVLAAGGYSGHGVALATLAGKLTAEAVQGESDGFDAFAAIPHAPFPGGTRLRRPLLALAMSWFALRDRLGF